MTTALIQQRADAELGACLVCGDAIPWIKGRRRQTCSDACLRGEDVAMKPMQPVDVDIREAAEIGLAWRRCEAALFRQFALRSDVRGRLRLMAPKMTDRRPYSADVVDKHGEPIGAFVGFGDAPADALNALADALERRAAE